jgi:predicted N-acetyltransferase YhbS
MIIRAETPTDAGGVRRVLESAFDTPAEADAV